VRVSLAAAAAFAVRRHGLVPGTTFSSADEAAAAVLGLHAQLMTSAAMSAAARVAGYDRSALDDDLYRRRSLVKAWCMRGTLHLLAARDFGLALAAIMRKRAAEQRDFLVRCGFGAAEIDALAGRVARALEDGPATRKRLHELVPELKRIPEAQWGQDVKDLCYQGLVVHAEPDGNEARFARADAWLSGPPAEVPPEAATAELLRRYLHAYGPASLADFASWAGFDVTVTGAAARRRLGDAVREVEVEGYTRPLLMLSEDEAALARVAPLTAAFPLPRFDPLIMGLKDRRRFVGDQWRQRLLLPGGFVAATLWSAGRVVGIWDFQARGGRMIVEAAAFRGLTAAERSGLIAGWQSLAPALGATGVEVRFNEWQKGAGKTVKEG
jgi:hypothetical protein